MKKRIVSIFLAVIMIVGMIPLTAIPVFAEAPGPKLFPDFNRDGVIDLYDYETSAIGSVFTIWLNDDDDAEGTEDGENAGDTNSAGHNTPAADDNNRDYADETVNGRSDLLDFFPVLIDLNGVADWRDYKWTIKTTGDANVNVVFTSLDEHHAGSFYTQNVTALDGKTPLHKTATVSLADEVALPEGFLKDGRGVFLIEGSGLGKGGIELIGKRVGSDPTSFNMPINVVNVEDMYRTINLRQGGSSKLTEPTAIKDADSDGRQFVFVHGFNVNHTEARGEAAEFYKKLWQSGSDSMFTAVEWESDESMVEIFGHSLSFNYYANVENAFAAAQDFKNQCDLLPGRKYLVGHSLGNMLICSAIQDFGLEYEKYFMLNAAIAKEAFDKNALDNGMVDDYWENNIPESERASHWYGNFGQDLDFRSTLTWKGRFEDVKNNVVNLYSSTDEFLANCSDDVNCEATAEEIKNTFESKLFPKKTGYTGNFEYDGFWAYTEKLKGTNHISVINELLQNIYEVESSMNCEGGWGVNENYILGDSSLSNTRFTPFIDERMASEEPLTIPNDEAFALRAQLLADAIPAESYAVGSNTVSTLTNINLESFIGENYDWPSFIESETELGNTENIWKHNDTTEIAYYHTYKLFDYIFHKHSYEWNKEVGKNGIHTLVCTNTNGCDELTKTEECTFENGVCTVCGAEGMGKYIARKWDETKKQFVFTEEDVPEDAVKITADTRELESGWYFLSGKVAIDGALTVSGNAHIVLANNADFTVSKGITVKNGANLTFYAQTDDFDHMGKVVVTKAYSGNAGIGSARQGECGDITINGGTFYVTGGMNGAGIGAGADGKCGTVTVNGGKVFSIGGDFGAGIGSGSQMDDGYENICAGVVINGGVILAVGNSDAENIGKGYDSPDVTVTVAEGVYENKDFPFACINIELFPEKQPSCADGHKDYFKNCVNGRYYTTETLEPESIIEDIDEWLAGEGKIGEGNGNHKDADGDGYCDTCGTLARANINFYISHGDTPAFTLPCIADEKLMKQTDELAQQAVKEKYGTTAGLVNYMYSDGKLVNEYDLVPFGTESIDIYAVLAYDETKPSCTKNGHKEYYENTLEGYFYEDSLCTIYIGDADALKEWLSTPVEDGGGMIPATGESPLDTPTADDFTFILPEDCVYDGQPKQASVTTDKDGMGKITVKYQKQNGEGWDAATTDMPTEIGKYRVVISVSEGDNFAASATDISSEDWVFEITCQHKYIDYVCEYCGDELFGDAQKDAIKAIDYTADHSDDEVIILLAETAKEAIDEFRDEYNTVADVLKIRDLTVSQINAIKAIIAAAGNSTNRTVKAAVIAAKADISSAETVEDVESICNECIADIEKLTGTSTHTHTFADTYSHNDTHHWRVCTCEDEKCKNLVDDFAVHTFTVVTNADGSKTYTCECGYTKVVYDKPDDEGEIISGTTYTGISLTLGSDISINFYMELSDDARQNGTMTFDIGGRIVTVDGNDAKYNETEKKYYFQTPLTALEMAEIVTATFTYNGVDYVQEYSVAEYIDTIVGNPDKYGKEAVALAKKIANYGYYAQIYLASIHTNVKIVDSGEGYDRMFKFGGVDIDVAKAIEALANYSVTVSGTSDNLSLYGSTVYFDSATALNYYVTVKNGEEPTATALNTVTGEEKQIEIKFYTGDIYIVSVKDITATELADDIKVTINGEITFTGSVFAYCNSVVSAHSGSTDKDTFAVNAMSAFYEYYKAAVDYAEDTVTFDNEPYCPSIYQTVKHGEKAHRPTDPMTANFVFDGWYADEERTIPWNFDTPITEDTTIYGKWISQKDYQEIVENAKFEVSNLRNNAISEIESLNLPNDIKQDSITEVNNVAYTAKWQIEDAKYTAEIKNIIAKATNKINEVLSNAEHAVEYTVSFDMMGHGEQVSSQPVKQGDKAQIPTTPTADGYQFDGWYLDDTFETPWDFDTAITENTTLYAKWAKLYTVSYIMSGHGIQINSQTVPDGGKVTRPADPTAEGYDFGGWYKDINCTEEWNFNTDTVLNNITLYAKWAKLYTVTFNMMNHGDQIEAQKVEFGKKITKPTTPTEAGYRFDGWYKNENYTEEWYFATDTVNDDITLYAKWIQTIDFDFSSYCLCGYINGADYGMTEQSNPKWNEPGEYVFSSDGILTVTFEEDSYIQLKTLHGEYWYAFNNLVHDGTPTKLYEASDTYREKMFVPGETTVTFFITLEMDGSYLLRYDLA